jgi:glutathione synthase/RimK-type ligase-like ATP-grasp enzyme
MSASDRIVLATSLENPEIAPSDRLYAEALMRRGFAVEGAPWDGPAEAFEGAAAIVIRSTWNYYRAIERFRAWTEALAAATRLFNPIDLVRWNLRKDYMARLAAAGVRVPATHFVRRDAAAIERVLADAGWERAVVKPASGASGYSVELVSRGHVGGRVGDHVDGQFDGALATLASDDLLVQEFLPEIADGEVSLVYFDGVFSHAVRKTPPAGEFRVNSRFGPRRTLEAPPQAIREQGATVLRVLPAMPLYARVDGVVRDGALIVIEVEVLEPALAMDLDPASAERFAEATVRRL